MLVGTARTALSAGQGKFCAKVSGFRRFRTTSAASHAPSDAVSGFLVGTGHYRASQHKGLSQMGLVWNRSSDSRSAK